MRSYKYLWAALGGMILLTPLGLLAAGTAWGEWGNDELSQMLGYVPKGLEELSQSGTHIPLPDYSVTMLSGGFVQQAAGYILSAAIGVLLIIGVTRFIGKMIPEEQKGLNE